MTTYEEIQLATEADDSTMSQLREECSRVSWRYKAETLDAALTLVRNGDPLQTIIHNGHLTICADIADLGYTMTDSADLVSHATATFGQALYQLPHFIRRVAEKPRRIR